MITLCCLVTSFIFVSTFFGLVIRNKIYDLSKDCFSSLHDDFK